MSNAYLLAAAVIGIFAGANLLAAKQRIFGGFVLGFYAVFLVAVMTS